MWLLATNRAKLKNFTTGGTKVKLLEEPEPDASDDHPVNSGIMNSPDEGPSMKPVTWSDPLVDAERRIPSAWKTVDRVLDAYLFLPRNKWKAGKSIKKGKTKIRVESDDDASEDSESERQRADAYDNGEQPGDDYLQTVQDWERRMKQELTVEHADQVIWAFFKWDDLGYEEGTRTYCNLRERLLTTFLIATWDAPPRRGEPGYSAFERAFTRFLAAGRIPKPSGPRETKRAKNGYARRYMLAQDSQPELGQDPQWKLMDYQACHLMYTLPLFHVHSGR